MYEVLAFSGSLFLSFDIFSTASIASMIYIEIFAYLGRNAIWGRTITKRPVYSNPSKKKEYMETIMIACNYINENFTHAISLDDAASITGFSKFHFSLEEEETSSWQSFL